MSFAANASPGRTSVYAVLPRAVRARARHCALLALLACVACGDDDGDQAHDDAGPRGAAGGSAGSGGASGGPAAPVACGERECAPPSNPFAGLPIPLPTPVACCVDEASGMCGIAMSEGAMCEPPAKPDSRCQGLDLSALANLAGGAAVPAMMSGCCIDNMCGLDGGLLGRGCVEYSSARAQLSMIPLIGTLLRVPAARACDAPPPPVQVEEDAGAEDDAGS